jgi:hypothetical protein
VLLVVLVVVTFAGGGSGGEDTSTVGGAQEDAIPVRLTPVGGSKASGGLTIVRVADQPVVDLAIRGLQPSGRGETYVLWFVGSGGRSLPVAFQVVGRTGGSPAGRRSRPPRRASCELRHCRPHPYARKHGVDRREAGCPGGHPPQRVGTSVLRGPLR